MERDTETTPVLFRRFKDGDIIALFPTIPQSENISLVSSYLHVGQHGAANLRIIHETRPATPEEYKDLAAELESLGYNLKVYKRNQRAFRDIRETAIRAWRQPQPIGRLV